MVLKRLLRQKSGKVNGPSDRMGEVILSDVGNTAAELFLTKRVPYPGKKKLLKWVVITRQKRCEIQNCKQKKAIGYALDKFNPTSRYDGKPQKFIFEIGTLNPHGINERFSFN